MSNEISNPNIQQRPPPPPPEEEDIIFPMEPEEPVAKPSRRQRALRLLRILSFFVLMPLVFALGYLSGPDEFMKSKEGVKNFASYLKEKTLPLRERVVEIIESKTSAHPVSATSADVKNAPAVSQGSPKKGPRKIKYWRAPMIPGYTSDKPGKSPMGMDLVPVYEDEGGGQDGIRISPIMTQNIGVKTTIAKRMTLRREIHAVGNLTYDERLVTHVHTKYEGWIEKLHVDFTGQEVKEDDLLLEIYSPELVSTQEELLLAMKYNQILKDNSFAEVSKGAYNLLESTRRRLELFDVPEHQIEELIRNKKITKTMHIHSPVSGFVIKKQALQGMYIKPGTSLYTIADLSNIWVLGDIYEYELPWVKIGQEVEMRLSYFPGKKFKGKVTFIDPFLNPKTRTVKVRMEFKNPRWQLKPDMYANLIFKSVVARKAIAIPSESVIHAGDNDIVIVRTSAGGFESRKVTLGPQTNGYVQVIKGIRPGEKVVTSSAFLIDSESNLREALSKMEELKPTPKDK